MSPRMTVGLVEAVVVDKFTSLGFVILSVACSWWRSILGIISAFFLPFSPSVNNNHLQSRVAGLTLLSADRVGKHWRWKVSPYSGKYTRGAWVDSSIESSSLPLSYWTGSRRQKCMERKPKLVYN